VVVVGVPPAASAVVIAGGAAVPSSRVADRRGHLSMPMPAVGVS
jgi:ABC-type Fe2+-enterobactin transport system substrate-binding protein